MQIETDAAAISAYIIFLSQNAIPKTETIKVQEMQEMDDLVLVCTPGGGGGGGW